MMGRTVSTTMELPPGVCLGSSLLGTTSVLCPGPSSLLSWGTSCSSPPLGG